MKRTALLSALVLSLALLRAGATPPEISNVRASQRDGTKLVDIYYDAADADGDLLTVRIEVSDNDGARYSVPAFTLSGDIGEGIEPGTGKHIVWDAGTDWDGEYSDLMRVMVFAVDAQGYPGMEWGNEVPPGGFLLGQDGGAEGSGPSRHVNIPWSYWLSKYEITSQQYCDFLNTAFAAGLITVIGSTNVYSTMSASLIQNMHGAYLLLGIGDDRDIRWNVNNFEVATNANSPVRVTWFGAAAFAHYYGYDLPTEAEWEKAARGPDFDDQDEHQVYAWGDTLSTAYGCYSKSGGLKPIGYYNGNQSPIGPDTVNGYGLYDMSGNVAEWTLTSGAYEISSYPQQENVHDLRHQYWFATNLCYKGGSWQDNNPAVYIRESALPTSYWASRGFRVARRYDAPERHIASREIFEQFESWPEKTDHGELTVSVASGQWIMTDWVKLETNTENAFSGLKCINVYNPGRIYFPAITNRLVEVQMKVKNSSSSPYYVKLYSGNTTSGYTYRSTLVPAYCGYTTISIQPAQDAESYYLGLDNIYGYFYIDDLEIWTIPRD